MVWYCICECGNNSEVKGGNLISGNANSCGCTTTAAKLEGQKFGKLTVLYRNGSTKQNKALWHCICECGNEHDAITALLLDGRTRSCGCLAKFEIGIAAMNTVYYQYRKQAHRRNLVFNLNINEFSQITQQNCHYCGIKPTQGKNLQNKFINGTYVYNGIDRKNNNLGYELKNCVPCCRTCNFAKRTMTYEDFINYIKRLANNKIWEHPLI